MVEEEEAPIHTDPRGFLSYKKKTQTMLNHLKNFFIKYPRHPTYLGDHWTQSGATFSEIPLNAIDVNATLIDQFRVVTLVILIIEAYVRQGQMWSSF